MALYYSMEKRVRFDQNPCIVHTTWSSEDYDRSSEQSLIYKKAYNKINVTTWKSVFQYLGFFKEREMPVHIDSTCSELPF